MFYWE